MKKVVITKVVKKSFVRHGKYKLTLEMMEGYNPEFSISRFRRDPISGTNKFRPLYLSIENEQIQDRDYSDADIFIAPTGSYYWNNVLELPYMEKVKKLELVRKNGEIIKIKKSDKVIIANPENPINIIRVY